MTLLRTSALAASLMGTAISALAAEDINWYRKYKQTGGPDIYLAGLANGIAAASQHLMVSGKAPIVCLPDDLRLSKATSVDLLEQELKYPSRGFKYDGTTLLEIPITIAMTSKYPCK